MLAILNTKFNVMMIKVMMIKGMMVMMVDPTRGVLTLGHGG